MKNNFVIEKDDKILTNKFWYNMKFENKYDHYINKHDSFGHDSPPFNVTDRKLFDHFRI